MADFGSSDDTIAWSRDRVSCLPRQSCLLPYLRSRKHLPIKIALVCLGALLYRPLSILATSNQVQIAIATGEKTESREESFKFPPIQCQHCTGFFESFCKVQSRQWHALCALTGTQIRIVGGCSTTHNCRRYHRLRDKP